MVSFKTSTSRLPADHAISGALLGVITTVSLAIKNKDCQPKTIIKAAVKGGIAGGFSIYSANQLVYKNYLNAFFGVTLGVGLLVATENVFENCKCIKLLSLEEKK